VDLRTQERVNTPSCFVCRWHGKHIVLWPQEPKDRPEKMPGNGFAPDAWTSGKWTVYINVHETVMVAPDRKMRSRHTDIEACSDHWFALWHNWCYIAWEEVMLDYIYNDWVDRMER